MEDNQVGEWCVMLRKGNRKLVWVGGGGAGGVERGLMRLRGSGR